MEDVTDKSDRRRQGGVIRRERNVESQYSWSVGSYQIISISIEASKLPNIMVPYLYGQREPQTIVPGFQASGRDRYPPDMSPLDLRFRDGLR